MVSTIVAKRRAIADIRSSSHNTILRPEVAKKLAKPFGFTPEVRHFRVGEEGVTWGIAQEFDGVPLMSLVAGIGESMGIAWHFEYVGRGFQMRQTLEDIERALNEEDNSHSNKPSDAI